MSMFKVAGIVPLVTLEVVRQNCGLSDGFRALHLPPRVVCYGGKVTE